MRFSSLSVRVASVAALMATATAHANLTIPVNALVADSVQAFSSDAMDAFALQAVSVTPLGNATARRPVLWLPCQPFP